MNPTRHDLSEDVRRKVIPLLQSRLADAIDLSRQAKQAHWNVKGPHFIALHGLFDAVYDHTVLAVDDLAERLVQLGGTADGTVGHVARTTSLPAYPAKLVTGTDHVAALTTSMAAFGKAVRWSIDEAAKLGDADTADLFTEISRAADKDLWMVEAHLQGDS